MRLSACPFHRQHAHTHARMHARTRACTHARTHTRKPIPPRSLARPCTCVPVRARLRPLRASASRAGGGEGGGWHEAHAFASVCASVRAHELVRVSLRARLVPCTALPHSTARRRGHKRCLKLLSRVRGTGICRWKRGGGARFAFCLRRLPFTLPSSATCSGTLHPRSFCFIFARQSVSHGVQRPRHNRIPLPRSLWKSESPPSSFGGSPPPSFFAYVGLGSVFGPRAFRSLRSLLRGTVVVIYIFPANRRLYPSANETGGPERC